MLLLIGLLLLLGTLSVLRALLDFVPLGSDRRETLERVSPIAGALVVLLYVLFAAGVVSGRRPSQMSLALALVVAGFVLASWTAIRDIVSGVFLKAGRVCRAGDHVRIGGVQGRVERMGLRVLVIETREGDEAVLPYSRVARASLLRTPVIDSVTPHVFRVPRPAGLGLPGLKALIRKEALNAHWSSIARQPEVAPAEDGTLEITVFSLDADHAPDVEAVVRRAIERRAASRDVSRIGAPRL